MSRVAPADGYNVRAFGAAGDGATLDTPALQAAVDAAAAAGGGTVRVPAGRYLTGSIFLKSCVTLHLDAGAVLLGVEDLRQFPVITNRWQGATEEVHASLISGDGLEHVTLTGRGTIDGQGQYWWDLRKEKNEGRRLRHPRPRLVGLANCTNVLIEGLTLVNSPAWTVNPVFCDNVTIRGLTVINPPHSPNTDGINPDSCRHVHISDCHVDVGDDCITIKSGTDAEGRRVGRPCERIAITNCTMVHGHGGVVIGSEMSGGVRDVVISNCIFVGTDRGIRLKSRRGRGGVVEDIRASNLVMRGVRCPFVMNLYYRCGLKDNVEYVTDKGPRPVTEETPIFRNIRFSHITAREAGCAAAFLYGLPEMPIAGVAFDDVVVEMAEGAQPGAPAMMHDAPVVAGAGFICRNVRDLLLRDVRVTPRSGPAFSIAAARDVQLDAVGSDRPLDDAPVVALEDVSGAILRGCRAAGEGPFLRVEGAGSRDIVLAGNAFGERATQVAEGLPDTVVRRA